MSMEVRVWNKTVSSLTLLALGTSAPEILLNLIDIIGKKFVSGDLGPSTIVGSAAFNLFAITAICVMSIPKGDTRIISSLAVYALTSFFSVMAYVWLAVCLLVISPNKIEIWEAVITLAMFPLLVVSAYFIDVKPCLKNSLQRRISEESSAEPDKATALQSAAIRRMAEEMQRQYSLTIEDAAKILAVRIAKTETRSHNWYRIHNSRMVLSNRRQKWEALEKKLDNTKNVNQYTQLSSEKSKFSIIEFSQPYISVLENVGIVNVTLERYGLLSNTFEVSYQTINGTAEAHKDYLPVKSTVTFSANEQFKIIPITLIDDDKWEPDEFFYIRLSLINNERVKLGPKRVCQIVILNDDDPGTFEFEKSNYTVYSSAQKCVLTVVRRLGADGNISVKWRILDLIPKQAFKKLSDTISFEHGEVSKNVEIPFDSKRLDREGENVNFQVELYQLSEGAKFGALKQTIVIIMADQDFTNIVTQIVDSTKMNLDVMKGSSAHYADQFKTAFNVNGGDIEDATAMDYVLHFITFFWKVLFAFVPPTSIAGGWLTFLVSLAIIGFLTAVIGDLATIFGCLVGLPDSITAITFVALGTSMPDTFASRQAAIKEKFADSSIGNINGSNSVNVFLGLGLPWLIASTYWFTKNENFIVQSADLPFTITLFTVTAIMAIIFLTLRRQLSCFGKAELGGRTTPKYLSALFFFLLWVSYIVLSVLQTYKIISMPAIKF